MRRLSYLNALVTVVSWKDILFIILFLALLLPYSTFVYANDLSAKAAVVLDAKNEKILYGKNPNLKLPPASTTKLITAMVAIDRLNPESIVTISKNAANTSSVTPHLKAGDKFTMRDLLHIALMRSVNGAAVALAEAAAGSEAAFVPMMNEKALEVGAENTVYINASGLPGAGQHTTAYDLAKIMSEALKYPLIREIINTRTAQVESLSGRNYFIKNTNHLLWTDEEFVGGKTGYTRAARHCFVGAAEKDGTVLISAVLGESVRDNLWLDTSRLLDKGYEVIAQKLEPTINITSEQGPVVLASYTVKKSSVKRAKRAVAVKRSKVKQIAKHYAVEKKKKKKSRTIAVARKNGAKKGKELSAYNQEPSKSS